MEKAHQAERQLMSFFGIDKKAQELPEGVTIAVALSNEKFRPHIICVGKTVEELDDLNKIMEKNISPGIAKGTHYEILIFNDGILNREDTTDVKILLTEENDLSGEYPVNLNLISNNPDGSKSNETASAVIKLAKSKNPPKGSNNYYVNEAELLTDHQGVTGVPAIITGKTAQLVIKDYQLTETFHGGTGISKIVHTYNGTLNLTLDGKVLPSTIEELWQVYDDNGTLTMGMDTTYEVNGE